MFNAHMHVCAYVCMYVTLLKLCAHIYHLHHIHHAYTTMKIQQNPLNTFLEKFNESGL